MLTVAVACGRPPGVHELPDVLLEYHLAQPGESGSRIAALLDPVAGRPELTDTVRVHLRLARNRRATARELGVHPNTVDNRLARFHVLTGIDVATDQGAALVLAATLQRDAQRGGPRRWSPDPRTPGPRGTPGPRDTPGPETRQAREGRRARHEREARHERGARDVRRAPIGHRARTGRRAPTAHRPRNGHRSPPAVGTGPDSAPLSPAHATHLPRPTSPRYAGRRPQRKDVPPCLTPPARLPRRHP
ncbi:hypothetical protein DN402_04125 [Streptomyces sp. SW4]|nr:hypothetical protein DN402_04125 [Streptomyces sp. SW4]